MVVAAAVSSVPTKYGRNIWLGVASRQPNYDFWCQHVAANPLLDASATSTSAKPYAESAVVTKNLAKLILNRTHGAADGDEYGRRLLRWDELRRRNGFEPERKESKFKYANLEPVRESQLISYDPYRRYRRKHAASIPPSILATAKLS